MFNNIGEKIKALAKVSCWVGILSYVLIGIVLIAISEDLAPLAIILIFAGSFLSWIGSFLLFGFGQLIENSDILVRQNQKYCEEKDKSHNKVDSNNVVPKKHTEKQAVKKVQEVNELRDEYIDIHCPNCKETLSFPKSELSRAEMLTCPFCDSVFSAKDV